VIPAAATWRAGRWPAVALPAVAVPAGLAVERGGSALLVATAGVALLGVGAAVTLVPRDRARPAIDLMVMVGLLAPVAFQQERTAAQIASSPVTPLAIAQGLLPVVCLALVLLLARPVPMRPTPAELWLGGFLAVAAVSTAWSVAPSVTLLKALQLAVAYALVLVWIRTSPGQDLVARLAPLVHAVLLCAVAGLVVAPGTAVAPIPGGDPTPRLRGIFPVIAPDLLGFMAVVGLLYLAARVGPAWTLRREARAALAVAYVMVLLLTRARVSLALLAVGLVALLLQVPRRRSGMAFVLPLAGVGALCILSLFAADITTFIGRGENAAALSTLTGRTSTWSQAADAWAARPLTGYGFYAGHRVGPLSAIGAQNLDSMWVETLLDVGIVGTAPLVMAVFAGAVGLRKRTPATASRRLAVAVFAAALISSFVNPSLQQANYPMIVFAVVMLARPLPAPNPAAAAPLRGRRRVGHTGPVAPTG
jgi:O-antigen ligase